jgi:hypothetical protein
VAEGFRETTGMMLLQGFMKEQVVPFLRPVTLNLKPTTKN